MPFNFASIVPLIMTGANVAGNLLGSRAQTNALQNAGQIKQQATYDAMSQILSLYDQGRADLAPFRGVAPQALNRLQTLAGHTPTPMPQQTGTTAGRPMLSPSTALNGLGVQNAVGAPGSVATQRAQSGSRNALLGGLGGAAGTVGLGLASGAMLGGGAGFGATLGLSALGGPIGLGLGALGSVIGSQFGKYNPDKAAASRGIDEVSRQIWGTNTPGIPPEQLTQGIVADVMQGRKTKDQGKAEIYQALDSWVAGMKAAGVDDKIIESSVASQKQYLAPLRPIFGTGVV